MAESNLPTSLDDRFRSVAFLLRLSKTEVMVWCLNQGLRQLLAEVTANPEATLVRRLGSDSDTAWDWDTEMSKMVEAVHHAEHQLATELAAELASDPYLRGQEAAHNGVETCPYGVDEPKKVRCWSEGYQSVIDSVLKPRKEPLEPLC